MFVADKKVVIRVRGRGGGGGAWRAREWGGGFGAWSRAAEAVRVSLMMLFVGPRDCDQTFRTGVGGNILGGRGG